MDRQKWDKEDFHYLLTRAVLVFSRSGYENVTTEELWIYLTKFRWRNKHPKRYYQVIRDILKITPNDYFNYIQIKAQVYDVKSMDEYDLSDLI